MSDPTDMDRGYRRGAIMGLTMAEAFILIAFALLLLFAFWQWEEERENMPEVQAFKGLPYDRRQLVLAASQDGSIESFMALQEAGVDLKALASLQQAGQTLEDIASKISQAEAQQETMVGALKGALGDIVSGVGGQIDGNGSIILPDAVLFEQGSASITPVLDKFLANACEPWIATLKGSGVDIAEIKIEGHASSEWRAQSSPKQAYLGNLDLSQRRSQAVLRVCLDFIRDSSVLEWARTHMIAVGYSSVRPVMKDGQEDKAASRRVIFSATPNRKRLIDQIGTEANSGRDDN
ncbi:MAG: OmpA family protein [Rhodospirillales bacterium]|nr:OmpA family protein [Rhodospirillales bacterium]